MIKAITNSIRRNLAEELGGNVSTVIRMEDGVKLSEIPKPFATVEYMFDNIEVVSAGSRDFDEVYTFQVGVFARDLNERFDVQKLVRDILINPEGLTLYTDTGLPTDAKFACEVGAFTPMPSEDTASDTNRHRGYFDVTVRVLTEYASDEYTQ